MSAFKMVAKHWLNIFQNVKAMRRPLFFIKDTDLGMFHFLEVGTKFHVSSLLLQEFSLLLQPCTTSLILSSQLAANCFLLNNSQIHPLETDVHQSSSVELSKVLWHLSLQVSVLFSDQEPVSCSTGIPFVQCQHRNHHVKHQLSYQFFLRNKIKVVQEFLDR